MNNKFENEKEWRKKDPRASLIRIEHFTRLNTGLNLFLSVYIESLVSVFVQPIYIYCLLILNKAEPRRKKENWNRTADHSFEVPFYADYDLKDWAKFVSLFSQFRPRDGLLIEVDWYRTWVLCILRNNTRQRFITLQPKLLSLSVHWDFTARYILLAAVFCKVSQ